MYFQVKAITYCFYLLYSKHDILHNIHAALVFTMFKMITREKLHTWISNARVIPGV